MSKHLAKIGWSRGCLGFDYKAYSRNHTWSFENGEIIEASATPQFLGESSKIDPEEAFVASLSSCHMLTFLAICSRQGLVLESYSDDALGYLEKNQAGQLVISRVELNPIVKFGEGVQVSEEDLEALHDQSHHECFLANSVKTHISVDCKQTDIG